jgi:adenosine deaminase
MNYFEISIDCSGSDNIIKHIYKGDESDLLRPWYSALSNIYGLKTTNYDGYMHKATYDNSANKLNIVCYLLEDETKTQPLKVDCENWKHVQIQCIEKAVRDNIERLNININPKIVILPIVLGL